MELQEFMTEVIHTRPSQLGPVPGTEPPKEELGARVPVYHFLEFQTG